MALPAAMHFSLLLNSAVTLVDPAWLLELVASTRIKMNVPKSLLLRGYALVRGVIQTVPQQAGRAACRYSAPARS